MSRAEGKFVSRKKRATGRTSTLQSSIGLSTLYHMTRLKNDALGLIEESGKIRVSLPRLLDSFEENMIEMALFHCVVVHLHELAHWAEDRRYADDDTGHNDAWNALLGAL